MIEIYSVHDRNTRCDICGDIIKGNLVAEEITDHKTYRFTKHYHLYCYRDKENGKMRKTSGL